MDIGCSALKTENGGFETSLATSEFSPLIRTCICKSKYPGNQNEMLEIMAHPVLRRVLEDINRSTFLVLMVDKMTDLPKSAAGLDMREVSEDFTTVCSL